MMKKITVLILIIPLFSCDKETEPDTQPEPTVFEVEGDYIGTWDDNFYSGFPISTKLSKRGTDLYAGPFFYSSVGPYLPCCNDSGDNGRISFEISGDSVINFRYIQDLQFYMGGCPGNYIGSGLWDDELGLLTINFTGDDCDGSHMDGVILLRNQR